MVEPRDVLLGPGDLADSVELARSVGWADSEGDWRILHALGRGSGVRAPSGTLLAQCMLCEFGEVATIAKMIVRAEARGRGLASRLMRRALDEASCGGATRVALIATPLGRPVYEKLGF